MHYHQLEGICRTTQYYVKSLFLPCQTKSLEVIEMIEAFLLEMI